MAELPPKQEWIRWIIVTLLIPFAGFVWNTVQSHEAERQKEIEHQRANSELVIKLLPSLADQPESRARNIALAVLANLARRDPSSESLNTAVTLALRESDARVQAGSASPSERTAVTQIAIAQDQAALSASGAAPGEGAKPSEPSATPTETGTGSGPEAAAPLRMAASTREARLVVTTPRIYVQIFDESDHGSANELRRWASDEQHWLVPGVENVVATASAKQRPPPQGTPNARVVYFNDSDAPLANEAVAWLRGHGQPEASAQRAKLNAPLGQIEVWYPQRSR